MKHTAGPPALPTTVFTWAELWLLSSLPELWAELRMDGRVLDSLRDAVLVGFGHLDTNLALTPLEWAVGSLWGTSYLVTHVWKLPR